MTGGGPAASVTPITDEGDERVGDFVGLSDPDLTRLRRGSDGREGGYFIAEGALAVRQLLRSPYAVRSILATEHGLRSLGPDLEAVDAPVYLVSQELVERITGFHFHRGALASGWRQPPRSLADVVSGADLVLGLEGVNDHENLGSLFRNAAAFGVGAAVLDPTTADPLYRRSIRVSMGHVLRVPFVRPPAWPAAISDLRALGYEVVALTPDLQAGDLRDLPPRPKRVLLVGSEGPGLSAAALAGADRRVRIAMAPGVDSLNVAAATAVGLHHLARL